MPNAPDSNDNRPASALDLFLGSFGRVNLALGGGLAVIASVLIWHFVPSTPVQLWIVVLFGLPTLMVLSSLVLALRSAVAIVHRQSEDLGHARPTTNIVDAVPPSPPYSHCTMLLIVKWSASATLPVGSNVKITIAEEHHERHLALGTVRETLSNGNYVVSIDQPYQDGDVTSYIEKLRDKNAKPDLLGRIRIGSTISFQHLSPMMLASYNAPVSPVVDTSVNPQSAAPVAKGQ